MEVGRACNALLSKRIPLTVAPRTLNHTAKYSPRATTLTYSNARSISTSSPSSSPAQAAALASNQSSNGATSNNNNRTGNRPKNFRASEVNNIFSKIGLPNPPPTQWGSPNSNSGPESRNIYQMRPLGDVAQAVRSAVTQNREGAEKWFATLRISPTLGKSIAVDPSRNRDAASAISMLEARLQRNKLPLLVRQNRFHVRRGQLKKHMRTIRWKRLFAAGFRTTVQRCEKLRAQGW